MVGPAPAHDSCITRKQREIDMFEKLERGRIGAALLVAMFAAACGGGGDAGGEGAAGGEGGAAGGAAAATNPVDPATAGSIGGHVMFTGTPNAGEPIDMADEPKCATKQPSAPMKGADKVANGGLDDVFVYVKSGPVTTMQFPVPTEHAVLDQEACIYVPHVLGLMAGQTLEVQNSDSLQHNVNATPTTNRGFNRSQPTAGITIEHTFTQPEVMIPVKCDVHGWMEGFIGVTSHPYHAVTANGGTFNLSNLPPGEYVIEAWHSRYGTQEQTVTVPASGSADVMFTFNAEMASNPVPMGKPLYVNHATGTLSPTPSNAQHAHSGR
jgi:plastocyanin